MEEEEIQKLENEFPNIAGEAFATARKKVLKSGQNVLQTEGNCIYRVFPDGHKELVKEVEAATVAGYKVWKLKD